MLGLAGAGAPAAPLHAVATSAFARGATSGGSSLYITGVTSRASSVDEINPPMITIASGE